MFLHRRETVVFILLQKLKMVQNVFLKLLRMLLM